MKQLEDVFKWDRSEFQKQQCGTMGDLEKIGTKFEICNALNPSQTVRKVSIGKQVCIDAMDGNPAICFPKETPVYHEPWVLDRGSYLVFVEKLGIEGKLATELDPVKKEC